MSTVLKDVVRFDFDRLFNGAVDVDWLLSDPVKAERAATAFVFHGPTYHGVSQSDVVGTGHKLIDSASFFQTTIDNLASQEEHPFSLAIAGFGSGKSHMAVTLAQLLETTDAKLKKNLLANISQADEDVEKHIAEKLPALSQKVLVITINGMNNFDLAAEVLSQIRQKFNRQNISVAALENLRKRFLNAANVLQNLDAALLSNLFVELDVTTKAQVLEKLSTFDETTYARVHDFLASKGIPLIAIGDETIKDILNLLADKYVGEDKPYKKVLIIFDEFGHYTEFATTHSQIAGNGALQQLFEGIQENADKISFVGFIQYELKTYEQRLSSDYKNEIRRFITRFQNADKYYLSINLETLIASLLIKSRKDLDVPQQTVSSIFTALHAWFPAAANHTLWQNKAMFSRVIAEGCYPLSPLAVWLLFHLSAGGQYLQQRSALSLLKSALEANQHFLLTPEIPFLPPVCLWTEDLQREFEEVEDQTGRRAIVQSYNAVIERNGQHLSEAETKILRSVVLITQAKLKATDRQDALNALQMFSGLQEPIFDKALQRLETEWNVITWDDSFHMFDILGDSVSKSQFLKYLKRRVDEGYDTEQQSKLFIKYADLVPDYLNAVTCGFADENAISTSEWAYEPRYTYWSSLKLYMTSYVKDLCERSRFNAVDSMRGIVVYCYVDLSLDQQIVLLETKKLLKSAVKDNGGYPVPLIITLIFDQGDIGRILSEIDVLKTLPQDAKDTYGRLAEAHLNKQTDALKEKIKTALLCKHYITLFSDDSMPSRIVSLGQALFDKLFPKVLSFPFDGYKTSRTNAAQDCLDFTRKLLFQHFTYDDVKTMQVRQKNRITQVLQASWKVFNKDGTVMALPGLASAKSIASEWDKLLYGNIELNCSRALEIACASPYGANLASAGLLFAVYIQSRRDGLTVIRKGEQVDFSVLSDKLFDGTVLSTKMLQEMTLYKSESESSEWDLFLTEWDNASYYSDRVTFAERAEELESRLSVPMQIRWKYKGLKENAQAAARKIEEFDSMESDAISRIEFGESKKDIWVLSHGVVKLFDCADFKRKDPMWAVDEITKMISRVDTAKQFIVHHFDTWLKQQVPAARTINALTEFKGRLIGQTGSSLKKLQLRDQYDQLEKYVESLSKNFEAVAASHQVIDDLDMWLVTNDSLPCDITYARIQELYRTIKGHEESLSTHKSQMRRLSQTALLAELEIRSEKLVTLQKRVAQKDKEIQAKAKQIWNSKLSSETVESLLAQIQDMERIYAGDESNIEDFRNMKTVIQAFLNFSRQLGSIQIPTDDFNTQKETARKDFLDRFTEAEPPWDLEATFDSMIEACEKARNEASKNWFDSISERASELSSMTLQQADELLRTLSTPPVYFCGTALDKKLVTLRNKIEKHLEGKGVEWLYERFLQLSPTARKSFIALLSNK